MAVNWADRVSAFSRSPSHFLSGTTAEAFLAELLRELRDDRAGYNVKVLLLSPLCEHPTLLCPSDSVGEETALELMSVFAQCPPKSVQFRCHLLLALTSVLVCTSCVSSRSPVSQDFLDLLLQLSQDPGDLHGDGALHSLRATACDCLRELEACSPGYLSQHIELLGGLRQRETSRFHQAYTGLHTLVLRNAVYQLTQETGAGAEQLKVLLGGNTSVAWEADQDSGRTNNTDSGVLFSLILGPMGSVPTLQTGLDCKELRSILSSLLEESYLLTPLCQAALLHRLTELVAMVPGVPPAIFRAQLLRLLGTSKVCLLHTTLLMKCAFTDSLFSAEDEAFILKRLVVLSQHPLLSTPEKLFYMDCILHFPENRPISCSDRDETLPVLLTPRLASALMPTVFNDSATMLARLNLLSLVYLEEGEEGEGGEGRGVANLYDHLMSLLHIVDSGGSREIVVTFFRAAFLFLLYFYHMERYSSSLVEKLCELYLRHTQLAPHLISLADHTQDSLSESDWAEELLKALQRVITEAPLAKLNLQDLRCHLKMLARVAEEGKIPQCSTLRFLSSIIAPLPSSLCVSGDWRLGTSVLGVCRRLLVHPSLDSLLVPLADILQDLTCCYGDTDIQDHARLYYALLTTLSREKLTGVLAQGATEGGRQIKKRSMSSIVAESEGLRSALTIHQTKKVIFSVVEVNSETRQETQTEKEGDLSHGETDECPGEGKAALEAYRRQFTDPDFASEITLSYQLAHTLPYDPRFDQVFSIRLHFNLTDEHYEELSDISVPCLFRERSSPMVKLRLKPLHPYPTTLQASAIFTTQDGLSWHTILPDIHVAFQQVFTPLPAPSAWGRGGKLDLFEGLWDELCSEGGDCATSLFCCQLKEGALMSLVEKHFLHYLISDWSHKEECKVLFFLPPQSHVLLKITTEEDAVHFDIATDNWQLLPHITSYLLTITSSQDDTHS
ncbi:AP-5 complex subunit beta-1 [Pleuronectes platessa]|uniref:AP-5 complex subunit beta-1 n=1 Tax=Pleuronectes platessa TaxID=8262 RepID=UPI00232A7A12|nr:AP-5 complex subunit beta-1 [Pleuronectes platessa]